jgi:diguanylate cyclase (GGDEF)-like protein
LGKDYKFERVRLYAVFSFIIMSLAYMSIINSFRVLNNHKRINYEGFIVIISFNIIYNLLRYFYLNTAKLKSDKTFLILGCIDLFNVSYYFDVPALDQGGKAVVMFILIISCIYRGRKLGIILTLLWLPVKINSDYFFMNLLRMPGKPDFYKMVRGQNIIDAIYFQIMLVILVYITNVIYREMIKKESENQRLLNELEQHYEELTAAHDEIEIQNRLLRRANADLEFSNEKLAYSIGEFFTLQQISQAIGSILDMEELMKFVNDIVLGVMGVKYSSIILYNEKVEKLEVHTTNISDKENYSNLSNAVNCNVLYEILNEGTPVCENNVDSNNYIFTFNRNIKSLICVPLCAKARKYGLILIEQDFKGAFDDDKVRLFTIIGQQVSIAMENAEIYQKMHRLAITDTLTGIYNRLYFQEQLEIELNKAMENAAEGSIVMFDVDYFKKINDTLGHLFGDKVLKEIADIASKFIRDKDIFARIGGEEFIIMLPDTTLNEAYEICEKIRKAIACTSIADRDESVTVTASFGIANYSKKYANIPELLRAVDKALYSAKESGRNAVRISKE